MQSLQKLPVLVDTSQITLRVNHREFVQLCQDNPELRLELSATGEVIAMTPAAFESSEKNGDLFGQILFWNIKNKQGRLLDSSGGFTLPNGAVKSPDVSWFQHSKFENISLDVAFPLIVPDFVIELKSKSDNLKTLQKKMLEYRDNGVRLGWLINPQKHEVEIYRIGQEVEVIESPRTLSGESVLSGFVLDLSTIFDLPSK